jgi:16S rRNA (uracil1498-N3)-methyltransferase
MALPIFYTAQYDGQQSNLILDEETSRHIVQVLRMKEGQELNLTDGKGFLYTAKISEENKKHCHVAIIDKQFTQQRTNRVTIAISLLKNSNRFEWFLEKATEIGVSEIIPLLCERTEKEKFRNDRLHSICVSAMLQSQQVWLPSLHSPTPFNEAINNTFQEKKFIAHCEKTMRSSLTEHLPQKTSTSILLIGPEGDFTNEEIEAALEMNFMPVMLGNTRLRTETAGVVAAALMCN